MRNRHCYNEGVRYHRHSHRGPHFRSGWGPPWMGPGPRARRGDVRIAVLALLAEGPMHGYQIITELESRSGGVWRPSPGSVYPTLQLLEDEDLVTSQEVGGKRVYSITDAGRGPPHVCSPAAPGLPLTMARDVLRYIAKRPKTSR